MNLPMYMYNKHSVFFFSEIDYLYFLLRYHKIIITLKVLSVMDINRFLNSDIYKNYKYKYNNAILVDQDLIDEITNNITSILNKKYINVDFFTTKNRMSIFRFNDKRLVFKMSRENDDIRTRYKNMLYSRYIIDHYNLDLLYIPAATIIDIKSNDKVYTLLIEEYIDLLQNKKRDYYFEKFVDKLDDTIHQLALFICKTGFSDVTFRNIPIMSEDFKKDDKYYKRIALIDLQDLNIAEYGLFGRIGARGLLRCVKSLKQLNIVSSVAKENGIDINRYKFDFEDVKNNYI